MSQPVVYPDGKWQVNNEILVNLKLKNLNV